MDKLNNTQAIKKYLTPTGNAKESRSMVESPTVAGTPKPLVDLKNTAGAARKDLMSMLLMEVFVTTRQHNIPDPLLDPIQAVFYSGIGICQTQGVPLNTVSSMPLDERLTSTWCKVFLDQHHDFLFAYIKI